MLLDSIFAFAILCSVGILPVSHTIGTGGLLQALSRPVQLRSLPEFVHAWLRGLLSDMAELAAQGALTVLLPPKVMAQRLDPYILAGILCEPMQLAADRAVSQALSKHSPMVWEMLPSFVQEKIKLLASQRVPVVSIEVAKAICSDPARFADLKSQAVKKMLSQPKVLIDLVVEAGKAPMQFLLKLSVVWGGLVVLLAYLCWTLSHSAFFTLLVSCAVGYACHWFAIELLYFTPRKMGRFQINWYGPFYTRQAEIAKAYTHVVITEVMLVDDLIVELISGVRSARLHKMLHVLVSDSVDEAVKSLKPVVVNVIGVKNWQNVKHDLAECFWAELGLHMGNAKAYIDESLALQKTIEARLSEMSSREFEDVFRPTVSSIEKYYPLLGAFAGSLTAALVMISDRLIAQF